MGGNKFTGDQESSTVPEDSLEQKSESWGSWFCRHGSQIAKGSIALLGLGAIGVVTKMLFGLKSFSSREGASSSVSRVEEVSDDVAVLFEGQSVPIVSQRLQMPKEQPKLLSNFVVEKKA